MLRKNLNSILGGISQTYYHSEEGKYLGACAIDPDEKLNNRVSGAICPVAYQALKDSGIKEVMWFVPNDVDSDIYFYTKGGVFGKLVQDYGEWSVVGLDAGDTLTLVNASGNGLAYYNNYYYIAKDTDIDRYGPMNGTPVLTNNWWSAQAGLEALGNTTYHTLGEYNLPNHYLHVHPDQALYVADYQGKGMIHRLKMVDLLKIGTITKDFIMGEEVTGATSGAKGVIAGAGTKDSTQDLYLFNVRGTFQVGENLTGTTQGSAKVDSFEIGNGPVLKEMGALSWASSEYPVAMEALGTDLGIIAMKKLSVNNSGNAKFILWDTINKNGFYASIPLPYPIVTAIKSYNGIPYIWGGDEEGYSLTRYIGAESVEPFFYIDNGLPPLQGAVTALHNRIVWGSSQTYPETRGCLWSWSSRARFSGLHNIASTGKKQVSAVAPIELKNSFIVSAEDNIYLKGGSYDSIWRSELLSFGRPFSINSIYIPIKSKIENDDKITIKLYYDNETTTDTFVIKEGTYDDNIIKIYPEVKGIQNAFIEAHIESVTQLPIIFPISIDYDIFE